MKNKLIKILSLIFRFIDGLLYKLHLKNLQVVVYVDGGICSQMLRYLDGLYYAEKGFDVYYDTLWFKRNGTDQFGKMPRLFELEEMWPMLEVNTLSKWCRKWYLIFFKAQHLNGDWLPTPDSISHSLYLNDYWDIPLEDFNRLFKIHFRLETAHVPTKYINFDADSIVGIHVRRGDLAKGDNPYYGGVTDGYFLRAIDYCTLQFSPKKYIFFSDEPDWVEQNICTFLALPYEIMRGNKAWEDLWLLAQCPIIVASQGSFGKVAARLNPNAVLIQCDNKYAWRDRENTYFIQ